MKIERLRQALSVGHLPRDEDFDEVYPLSYRQVSARFWTSVETARRACQLLVQDGPRRILDVGAGVGKFCLVGAASTPLATFVGIEQRAHLVDAAREAARRLDVTQVEFVHGRLEDLDTSGFDGFYFFNPFGENLQETEFRLDSSVALSAVRFRSDVALAGARLAMAPLGTRVVTYDGYGGRMPQGYTEKHVERSRHGALSLWIKTSAGKALSLVSRRA